MPGLLTRAKKAWNAFAYDATEPRNRRRKVIALERSEDAELPPVKRSQLTTTNRNVHRNWAIASWMVRKHLDYVSTFKFHCRHSNPLVNQKVETFVKDIWSKRKNCDIRGRFTLRKMIRLSEARRTIDGDILLVKLATGHLQGIEGDRVRSPMGGVPGAVDPAEYHDREQ